MLSKEMNIGKACGIFKCIRTSTANTLDKGQAIKQVLEMPTHNGITKDEFLQVCQWLWDMVFEEADKCREWIPYKDKKPTEDKDYFTIVRHTDLVTSKSENAPKPGDIWVESDWWSNSEGAFDSIGKDNEFWDVLYWMDPGQIEIAVPLDIEGKVTKLFGEDVKNLPCQDCQKKEVAEND